MIEKLPKKVYWRNQKMIPISSMSRFFVIVIIAGLGLMVFTIFAAMAAESEAIEFDLDPNGQAFEIYWGKSGDLWITDGGSITTTGALWQIMPKSNTYTRYGVPIGASDAHVDGSGKVWWANFNSNTLNRLVPGEITATSWPLTGTNGVPTGIAIDGNNDIWVIDPVQSLLQRFDPDTSQLCGYELPNAGAGVYLISYDNKIWLADDENNRIVQFNPLTIQWKYWPLDHDVESRGITVDNKGNLWLSDQMGGFLIQLTPFINRVTEYLTPQINNDFHPKMITFQQERLWYSDQGYWNFGWINTNLYDKKGDTYFPNPSSVPAQEDCKNAIVENSNSVSISSGSITWIKPDPPLQEDRKEDWATYRLDASYASWGIAVGGCNAWIIDQSNQRLVKFTFDYGGSCSAYLPAIVKP